MRWRWYESDLDPGHCSILIRHGKGGKRREVGIDRWAWEQLGPWLQLRATLPAGALFCVLRGPTRGRSRAPAGVRAELHAAAARADVRRRFAPHQLRHAHAVEISREGVPLLVTRRQLGHADLAITSMYRRGIDNTEIVHAVHQHPAPMIPPTRGLCFALEILRWVVLLATHPADQARQGLNPDRAKSPMRSRAGCWRRGGCDRRF